MHACISGGVHGVMCMQQRFVRSLSPPQDRTSRSSTSSLGLGARGFITRLGLAFGSSLDSAPIWPSSFLRREQPASGRCKLDELMRTRGAARSVHRDSHLEFSFS